MQRPILTGRLGKWAYSLVEFEMSHAPLKVVNAQIVANFIVNHGVELVDTWKLFFDGSVCEWRSGIGCVIASPHGEVLEMVTKLEFKCTNNQAEYEALLAGLEELVVLGARDVEAFASSNLVVLQVLCHTPFWDSGNEASIRVSRMFHSHV
jgi:hypothetical protein